MDPLPTPDLAQCAIEPICSPGAIQPHGRMAVLDARDGHPLAYSAN
jgi:two-component system, chemotaxis family, sensor kinase Cph1